MLAVASVTMRRSCWRPMVAGCSSVDDCIERRLTRPLNSSCASHRESEGKSSPLQAMAGAGRVASQDIAKCGFCQRRIRMKCRHASMATWQPQCTLEARKAVEWCYVPQPSDAPTLVRPNVTHDGSTAAVK